MEDLVEPRGVAVDQSGNVYASTFLGLVCKLSPDGDITLFAGTPGNPGFGGDGELAIDAQLNGPSGIGVDKSGNVYIADKWNHRVRKVEAASGKISTVAGIEQGTNQGGLLEDGKPATEVRLYQPTDVAFDSKGNLYIADSGQYHVRMVDATSQIITSVAGLVYPHHDDYAEGGPAVEFSLQPQSIAFDNQDNLIIADELNKRIYRLTTDGLIRTIFGGKLGNSPDYDGPNVALGALVQPLGIAVDSQNNILIADAGKNRVLRLDNTLSQFSKIAGDGSSGFSGDGGPAIDALLSLVSDVAINSKGDLYIADTGNYRIRKIGSSTPVIPQAPKNIATQSGDGQVTVSWDAPVGGAAAAGITGYTVTATPEGKECKAGPDATSCVVSGLSNATAYNFVVVANSAAGPSPSASSEQPVTPVASVSVPPEASSLPRAEVGKAYNATIRPTGGTAPYQFRIVAGSLPTGLSAAVSADGSAILISGTPAQTETAIFSMEIADSTVAFKRNTLSKAGPTITTVTLAGSITVAAAGVVPPVGPTGATPVPTLNQWGLMLLSLILAGFAAVRVRPSSLR